MKRILITTGILMITIVSLNAQRFGPEQRQRMQQRIEAQRVAFITNQLDLTADESAAFWPIYNEFKEKEREKRRAVRPEKDAISMSESEARDFLESQLQTESELIDLKREYFERMSEVISTPKVVRLNQVEMEFNRGVLERLKAHQEGGPGAKGN